MRRDEMERKIEVLYEAREAKFATICETLTQALGFGDPAKLTEEQRETIAADAEEGN